MVTTRSKSLKVGSKVVSDNNNVQATANESFNSKSKKSKSSKSSGNFYPLFAIFSSLLLDLLAFTIILPLFPSILDHYKATDGPNGLYSYLEKKIEYFRRFVGASPELDSVLFGGFLGSLFSFLQFVASPIIGAFSDVFGRKVIILLCLVGLAASYFIWSISTTFLLFVVSRILGGISKGNLSLSMAAVTDVSSSEERNAGMALVGAAFSIGFTIGPMIGAVFAKRPTFVEAWLPKAVLGYNLPALFAFTLIIIDIFFVLAFFKETLAKEKRIKSIASSVRQALVYINVKELFQFTPVKFISNKDLKELRTLGYVYFLYLFLYSGLEFTLTFLTHFKFKFTTLQQGYMYFGIGITMALLQLVGVRKISPERVQSVTTFALLLIVPSFVLIGIANTQAIFIGGVFLFSASTSVVVTCMTTMASKYGSQSQKGTTLGIFRSLGALARATGPIFASVAYWTIGSTWTYCTGGVLLLIPWYLLQFSSPKKS